MSVKTLSRREFLALCWFPFFWRRGVTLGGIRFRRLRRGSSSTRYLVIHGDEQTARFVLSEHMRSWPGVAYLVTGEQRTVRVPGGTIDPNRMFSREGAETSLRRLNPGWPEAELKRALDRLDKLRPEFVQALTPPDGGLLFALHNNARGYSVRDEVPISNAVRLNAPHNPHDFFLCTSRPDFAALADGPYNVVLQYDTPAPDDGSLSRYAARHGIRYVNLEVALGKIEVQRDMLEWAAARLTPDGPT